MLKGKALKDFADFLYEKYKDGDLPNYAKKYEVVRQLNIFNGLSFNRQMGDLLEFFRERLIKAMGTDSDLYHDLLHCFKGLDILSDNTAFTHAIDKACELYGRGE